MFLRKLLLYFLLVFLVLKNVKAVELEVNPLYLNEGLTQNQVINIKIYSARALNLILDAYSSLNRKVIYRMDTRRYLDAAMFFLNEAKQYSPSYLIKRQLESIQKRIKLYPDEDYSEDLKSIYIYIQEIAGNLDNYEDIKTLYQKILEKAKIRANSDVKDQIDILMEKLDIKLIDSPILEAQNLIGIAEEYLNKSRFSKVKKSLELALEPLIKLSTKETLYVALVKEYIYKAYMTYDYDQIISLKYVDSALIAINKAYYVSSSENRDILKEVRKKIRTLPGIFDNKKEAKKIFTDIINSLRNI